RHAAHPEPAAGAGVRAGAARAGVRAVSGDPRHLHCRRLQRLGQPVRCRAARRIRAARLCHAQARLPGGAADPRAGAGRSHGAGARMGESERVLPVRMQVVNKTGGGAAVAAAYLAEKKGDPNRIGFFTGGWLTSPLTSVEARVSLKDLTPVVRLVLEPAVIAVKTDAPYKTLADFVAAARQHPGQLKQSGGSITSRDNVVRQLLQKHTGARWAVISFPGGGERMAALLGGHVNMMVIEPAEAGEHIRAGN